MSFNNHSDEYYLGGEGEAEKPKKSSAKGCCGMFAMCGAKTRKNLS